MSERDYGKLLSAGNKAQLEKLQQNEHKSGFDNINVHYAFRRLTEELKELEKKLFQGFHPKHRFDIFNTRAEAADIANFAHMIILACDQENEKGF